MAAAGPSGGVEVSGPPFSRRVGPGDGDGHLRPDGAVFVLGDVLAPLIARARQGHAVPAG